MIAGGAARAVRVAAIALALVGLASCGETEPRWEARVTNAAIERGTHRVAVAVRVARVAHPTGLARFPDGGVVREVEARAEIWRCDAGTGEVERVLVLERPRHMRWGFQPWIAGWHRGSIVAQVTGHPKPETSPGSLRLQLWRIDPSGRTERLQSKPEDTVLEQRPPVDGRRPKSARAVEVSVGWDTVSVRTERDAGWRPAFALESGSGQLRTLVQARASRR